MEQLKHNPSFEDSIVAHLAANGVQTQELVVPGSLGKQRYLVCWLSGKNEMFAMHLAPELDSVDELHAFNYHQPKKKHVYRRVYVQGCVAAGPVQVAEQLKGMLVDPPRGERGFGVEWTVKDGHSAWRQFSPNQRYQELNAARQPAKAVVEPPRTPAAPQANTQCAAPARPRREGRTQQLLKSVRAAAGRFDMNSAGNRYQYEVSDSLVELGAEILESKELDHHHATDIAVLDIAHLVFCVPMSVQMTISPNCLFKLQDFLALGALKYNGREFRRLYLQVAEGIPAPESADAVVMATALAAMDPHNLETMFWEYDFNGCRMFDAKRRIDALLDEADLKKTAALRRTGKIIVQRQTVLEIADDDHQGLCIGYQNDVVDRSFLQDIKDARVGARRAATVVGRRVSYIPRPSTRPFMPMRAHSIVPIE